MRRLNLTLIALLSALLAAALALSACGGDDETTSTTTATTGGDAASACESAEEPQPQKVKLKPPKGELDFSNPVTATVKTNCGEFEFELDTANAPKTAQSFIHLVDEGVYDDTTFHRVVSNFVIQGGDPALDGSGGPGYTITEKPPVDAEYTKGTVAMAKTAAEPPGTSGSQFFVVTAADAGLPADYAILGHVTGGEDTVEAISAQADPALGPEGGEPIEPVVIESITLS